MPFKNITVAGSGVLGSQIAFQTAFKGFYVSVYDINDEAIEKGKERLQALKPRYKKDLGVGQEELDEAYKRLEFHTDLGDAVSDADLVIEAVPEVLDIKKGFYMSLVKVAPEKAVFVSNSSTMIPSQLVGFTDRPEKYLHLHFANEIWRKNVAEVMKHEETAEEVFKAVIKFAEEIGMVPIPLYKEQPGYVLNSLLVPLLEAAENLVINDIADFEMVDKTWMISTGAPRGPFAILDAVGINTPYNLNRAKAEAGDENAAKIAEFFKNEFIDKGRKTFYNYPNPRYLDKNFLK